MSPDRRTAEVLGFRVPPVVRSVDVALPPVEAFDLFTRGIHRWWPTATHSLGEDRTRLVAFDGHVGGRLYERLDDGTELVWGTVLAWRAPAEVSFTWHVGRAPDTAQTVTVRFTGTATGTRVELTHAGWEALGRDAAARREGYASGWRTVLARYAAAGTG